MTDTIRVPAIKYVQSGSRELFSFVVDVKQIPRFTSVSHIRRESSDSKAEVVDLTDSQLVGYQRPEVIRHIGGIRRYLETDDAPMIPNALVIAFDERVTFESLDGAEAGEHAQHGWLAIPLDDENPCGALVDGQQRSAAIRDADVDSFPMNVTAFIPETEAEERTQFILVNNSKPLGAGLVHELLPGTNGTLPRNLARRQFPAIVLEFMNHDRDSPFFRRIKTSTNPDGVLSDRALLGMIETSLAEGVLYRYRNPLTGDGDVFAMCGVLSDFWQAVADVFPIAWGIDEPTTPRKSRLVHGAGLRSMGSVMDAIADIQSPRDTPSYEQFKADLELLEPECRWTNGSWKFGAGQIRKWNELQNTGKDITLLTNHLLALHRQAAWGPDSVRSTA